MNSQPTATLCTILDENSDFIIVSKHHNVDFHKGNSNEGLCSSLRASLKCDDIFPVHRLDSVTSGLIIFAKNKQTARELSAQFQTHSIEKYYVALSGNHPKKKQGTISGDMQRSRNGAWMLLRTKKNPAMTHFFSAGLGNGLRLYIIRPLTGRTHQIRVALKSLGVPVFGDPLYSSPGKSSLQADRTYLHAYTVRFQHRGTAYCYQDLPQKGIWFNEESTTAVLKKYLEPWNLPWPKQPGL